MGDELLRGESREGNGFELISRLEARGVHLNLMTVVPDDRAAIAAVIQRERAQGSLLILSGGLGPTDDDFTRSAVAEAVGVAVERDSVQVAALRARYAALGRAYSAVNDRQADRPTGAEWLENPVGTAPGFWFPFGTAGGVMALPGVPSEFRKLLDLHLERVLNQCGVRAVPVPETTFKIFGIPESEMQARIAVLPHYGRIRMRSLPAFPEIRLKIAQSGDDAEGYQKALQEIREELDWRIFTDREANSHAGEVLASFQTRGWQLKVEEELEASGGELASLLAQAALKNPGDSVLLSAALQLTSPDSSGMPPAIDSKDASGGQGIVILRTRCLPPSPEGATRAELSWCFIAQSSDSQGSSSWSTKEVSFPVFQGSRHRSLVAHSALLHLRRLTLSGTCSTGGLPR